MERGGVIGICAGLIWQNRWQVDRILTAFEERTARELEVHQEQSSKIDLLLERTKNG